MCVCIQAVIRFVSIHFVHSKRTKYPSAPVDDRHLECFLLCWARVLIQGDMYQTEDNENQMTNKQSRLGIFFQVKVKSNDHPKRRNAEREESRSDPVPAGPKGLS